MLRLGILVSGGGTNLQAILDALDQGVITNAAVSVVISNNSGAYALKRAEDRGILSLIHILPVPLYNFPFPKCSSGNGLWAGSYAWRNF